MGFCVAANRMVIAHRQRHRARHRCKHGWTMRNRGSSLRHGPLMASIDGNWGADSGLGKDAYRGPAPSALGAAIRRSNRYSRGVLPNRARNTRWNWG